MMKKSVQFAVNCEKYLITPEKNKEFFLNFIYFATEFVDIPYTRVAKIRRKTMMFC